ncbi:MAG: hypothetical protein Q7O66_21115 [Dehalococcoidia bacterium]|nr:hypothetical protein [Dehalococcoidia bacterium]
MVEPVRGRIRIEIIPWLTRSFGQRGSSRLILEEEIDNETGMIDFLTNLSKKYPAVGVAIVDLQAGQLFDHVEIVHNDVLLGGKVVLEQVVRDGDTLVFLPAFAGG